MCCILIALFFWDQGVRPGGLGQFSFEEESNASEVGREAKPQVC